MYREGKRRHTFLSVSKQNKERAYIHPSNLLSILLGEETFQKLQLQNKPFI